jgi:ABC-type transport system involved in multi-copper enzyme maturation permease subunit
MNFLPIADRELRVAARKRTTFWIRLAAAAIALLIAASLLFVFSKIGGPMPNKGKILFNTLAWMAFTYAFAAGIFLTADSLSEEKREGTLGLLFVTDLRGYDVILGKLAATSLHAVYAIVAVFPILALGLMLGGLLAADFWSALLAILNMLFVSLSAGMLASTFTRNALPAMNLTLFLLGILVGLPYVVDFGLANWDVNRYTVRSGLGATLHPFLIATTSVRGSFWSSLLLSHVFGWLCLVVAAWRVPRNWHEKPVRARTESQQRKALRSARDSARRSADPIAWLASRTQTFRLWILLPMLVGLAMMSVTLDAAPVSLVVATSLLSILSLLLYLWMTAHATRFCADGVRTGAFELILCTPASARQIVRGEWRAYIRTFAAPLVLLLIAQVLLLTISGWTEDVSNLEIAASHVDTVMTSLTTAVAIAWVGMWLGLRSRRPHIAVIKTYVLVLIIPGVALSIIMGILMIALSLAGNYEQVLPTVITTLLWVIKDVALILWARRNLNWRFRVAVAGIDLPRRSFRPVKLLRALRPRAAQP